MRTGAEVKVGLITLLAIALLALFTYYVRGRLGAARTYTVYVLFNNSRGLQQGDSVRMVGVKIGEVKRVRITPPPRKAEATLRIDREYALYRNYTFQIAATGLIQERSIEVIPTAPGAEGPRLQDQAKVQGTAAPDLADILQTGETLLTSLDQTSEALRSVLGNKELLGNIRRALESFAVSADSAAQLADTAAAIAAQSKPETQEILARLRMAAVDMQATTSTIRDVLQKGTTLEDLQQTAASIRETSKNAERLSASLAELASSPEVKEELKETIRSLRDMTATLNGVATDLKAFSNQLKEAAPSIPAVAKQAERISGTVTQIQERLKPPEIHGNFRVLYSGTAERSFSSGSLDIRTSPTRLLRLGIDDISEESSVNVQMGEQQRLGLLRYGLVRSRLGIGLDFGLPRRSTLSVDLFDPNHLRADILADMPLPIQGTDWGLMAGVRDLGQDNLFVFGARVKR